MKLHVRERLQGLRPLHAFRRWRDEIVVRAAALPRVRGLLERDRVAEGRRLRRLLQWGLDVDVPLVARSFVPSDALIFELTEAWDEERLGCEWTLRSRGLPVGAASAHGTFTFDAAGLLVEGEVLVDLGAVPQVPSGLAKTAGPALEQAIARQIEGAFRVLARAIR